MDVTRGLQVREREFAVLDVPARPSRAEGAAGAGPKVAKLADGFWSISGGAVGPDGKLWFVERRFHRIHGWSAARGLTLERDASLDPVNLAVDKAGNLMVLSADGPEGTVYSFKPGSPETEMTVIAPTPDRRAPGIEVAIPANYWNNGEFKDQYDPKTDQFTTLAEMFARDIGARRTRASTSRPTAASRCPPTATLQQGPRLALVADAMQTYGFLTAKPGSRVFVTNGSENQDLQRPARRRRRDHRPEAVRQPRRRERRGGPGRARLRRQRPGVRLRAGRQGGRPHRRAGAAAAAALRRHGPAHAVHPDAPRALLGAAVRDATALYHGSDLPLSGSCRATYQACQAWNLLMDDSRIRARRGLLDGPHAGLYRRRICHGVVRLRFIRLGPRLPDHCDFVASCWQSSRVTHDRVRRRSDAAHPVKRTAANHGNERQFGRQFVRDDHVYRRTAAVVDHLKVVDDGIARLYCPARGLGQNEVGIVHEVLLDRGGIARPARHQVSGIRTHA